VELPNELSFGHFIRDIGKQLSILLSELLSPIVGGLCLSSSTPTNGRLFENIALILYFRLPPSIGFDLVLKSLM